jgi:hypothetical protein
MTVFHYHWLPLFSTTTGFPLPLVTVFHYHWYDCFTLLVFDLMCAAWIQVGVDVPEASIMVVEGADRFGLASLHQLRGRVGRGERASRCFLVTGVRELAGRLRLLENCHNGFQLAQLDLKIRCGPDLNRPALTPICRDYNGCLRLLSWYFYACHDE